MKRDEAILAERLGKTVHVSPLRFKLQGLRREFVSRAAVCLEDWLVETANARGARIVAPPDGGDPAFSPPPASRLSNEELVVALCQLQCLDRPQILRLAAQFVSRQVLALEKLGLIAERERAGDVLAELARQALRVDAEHPAWQRILARFPATKPLRSPLIHWTRLAEPVMKNGRYNADAWRLVA